MQKRLFKNKQRTFKCDKLVLKIFFIGVYELLL